MQRPPGQVGEDRGPESQRLLTSGKPHHPTRPQLRPLALLPPSCSVTTQTRPPAAMPVCPGPGPFPGRLSRVGSGIALQRLVPFGGAARRCDAGFSFPEATPKADWAPPRPFPRICFWGKQEAEKFHLWPTGGLAGVCVLFFFFLTTLQRIQSPQGLEHPDGVSMETKPASGPGPAPARPPAWGCSLTTGDPWDWGSVLLGRCSPSSWLCPSPRPDTRSCLGLGRRLPVAGTTVATHGALGCHRRCAQPPPSAYRIHAQGFSVVVL